MSGPRSAVIALALALLAVSIGLNAPPRALAAAGSAPPAGSQGYARVADRAARAWRKLQYRRGAFFDPYTREKSRGYGVAMIGYAMMQAGLRAGQPKLIAAGARAVADETKTPAKAGVFDQWIAPIAYELARGRLRREPRARALRDQLRRYLAALGEPRLGPGGGRCFTSPTCFSNHKIVLAEAKLELAASGLRRDAGALRAAGRNVVGAVAATATGRSGRASGPGPRRGLGVLSDTGVWPLGYHALSAMMLARAAWGERTRLPRVLRANLEHALDTLVAYAAPDGDVGFLGARQEQAWIPAATAYASEVGARIFARERGAARATRRWPTAPWSVWIAPTPDRPPVSSRRCRACEGAAATPRRETTTRCPPTAWPWPPSPWQRTSPAARDPSRPPRCRPTARAGTSSPAGPPSPRPGAARSGSRFAVSPASCARDGCPTSASTSGSSRSSSAPSGAPGARCCLTATGARSS